MPPRKTSPKELAFGLLACALSLGPSLGCGAESTNARGAGYAPTPSAAPWWNTGAWSGTPPSSPGAAAAVAFARSRIGTPYCWGGTGPRCYDCSGLTQASWWAAGKAIPRTSAAQASLLPEVPFDRLAPGDILWRPGHVALYVGDGLTIAAPKEGDVVKLARAVQYVKAVRP